MPPAYLTSPKRPENALTDWLGWLGALATLVLAIFRWGYEYGRGDQMQLLSYALYLRDNSLYPHDFFIQNLSAAVPNERYFFTWLISWLTPVLEPTCFALHVLFGVYLFWLCYRLAARFIDCKHLRWLAVLLVFIPLYNINLGGNELYYNTFFVSNPVKAFGLHAVLWLLNRKYVAAMAMATFVTLLQPVNGVQLFVTFSGILFFGKLYGWLPISWPVVFRAILLYVFTGLAYLLVLHFYFQKESVDDRLFFDILFRFRAPHHYLPHAFGLRNYLVLVPLFLLGAWYFKRRSKELYLFFVLTFLGCSAYVLFTEFVPLTVVASVQWFKATIWLKLFSCIAVVALVEKHFLWVKHRALALLTWLGLFGGAAAAVCWLLFLPGYIPWQVPYDFGTQYKTDPAVEIALKAKALTPKNAVFIQPMTFGELKYYGQRSSVVDYRVLVHRQDIMLQWHQRISDVYKVNRNSPVSGYAVYPFANEQFSKITAADLRKLQQQYALTHVLTFAHHHPGLKRIAVNTEYAIYELPQP